MREDGSSLKKVNHPNIGSGSVLSIRSKVLWVHGLNKRVRILEEMNNRMITGTTAGTHRFWSDLGMKA